jgi:hypothetical protein
MGESRKHDRVVEIEQRWIINGDLVDTVWLFEVNYSIQHSEMKHSGCLGALFISTKEIIMT